MKKTLIRILCTVMVVFTLMSGASNAFAASNTPATPAIKSVSLSGATAVKVSWKKAGGAAGYQIKYTNTKNKKAKTIKVKGAKKVSKTIKGLSSKTKYSFKVRSYKVVNKKTYYSKWSKSKALTTKKSGKISLSALQSKYAAAIKANPYTRKSEYRLVDIDKDGIPELFARHKNDEGGCFYYLNSKKGISHFDTGGGFHYYNKGFLALYSTSTTGTVFRLKGGKLIEIATSDWGDCSYHNKPISEKEYNKRIKDSGVDLNAYHEVVTNYSSLKSAFEHYKK